VFVAFDKIENLKRLPPIAAGEQPHRAAAVDAPVEIVRSTATRFKQRAK
jgi:hypothetical protein